MASVIAEGSKISIEGKLDKNSARIWISQLYHKIVKQGFNDLEIDLSKMTRFDIWDMLPVSSIAYNYFQTRKVNFILTLLEAKDVQGLFLNSNCGFHFTPIEFEEKQTDRGMHLAARRFSNDDQQHEVCNLAIEHIMRYMNFTDRTSLNALEWALNEVMDNVTTHSRSGCGGMVALTADRQRNLCKFIVIDTGVGICKTIREAHANFTSDTEALDAAIREGVTGKAETNQGNGLYGTIQLAEKSGGAARIWSNGASLSLDQQRSAGYGGGIRIESQNIPYQGTVVACSVDTSRPEILRNALVIKGHVRQPYGLLDKYDEDESIDVTVTHHVTNFGSRRTALPFRQFIENILNTTGAQIKCDFSDIPIVTSSFADEVFGKLVVNYGVMVLQRVNIRKAHPDVRSLIERAINLRIKDQKPLF